MFDRLFMAELWCNMLLSLFCTVRFVKGWICSWFPGSSPLVLFLASSSSFVFVVLFPGSPLGCFPFFSPPPFLVPSLFSFFFSLLVSFGALWVFYVLIVSSVFSPSMISWFSWNDHVRPEDFQAGHHPQTLESFYQYKTLQWLHLQALHGTVLKEWVWLEW